MSKRASENASQRGSVRECESRMRESVLEKCSERANVQDECRYTQ